MTRRRGGLDELLTSARYWWSVEDLGERWHVSSKTVHRLVRPHRGKCHLGRRGRHPRLTLWVPIDVVRALDRERRSLQKPPAENPVKTPST